MAGQHHQRPQRRMTREAEIEQPPHPGEIAPDRRIHEARKQRHPGNPHHARLGVSPRTDRGLEDFHRRADDVEHEYHLGLVPGFEAEAEHRDLYHQGGHEQRIVAGDRRAGRIPQVGRDQQPEHQAAEQARPALLEAEEHELEERVLPGAVEGEGFQPRAYSRETGVHVVGAAAAEDQGACASIESACSPLANSAASASVTAR